MDDRLLLQQLAWRDCLLWAASDPDILDAFRRETGTALVSAPTTPIDVLIDQAVGLYEEIIPKFIEWFNVNVWGEPEPPGVRATPAAAPSG